MRIAGALLLAALLCASGAGQKKPKPPDVQVLDVSARRADGKIFVDGRVRNTGEKPIRRLSMVVDFLASGRSPIASKKSPIEEDLLDVGDEADFHGEIVDPVRAVEYSLRAFDGSGRDLVAGNTGPFPILE